VELQIRVRNIDGVTILHVVGEVDLYTVPQLEEALRGAASGARPLLGVNLCEVTYLDSTGLRVLTEWSKQARVRQGGFAVIADQPTIQKLFRITGLGEIVPVLATEGEAIAHLKGQPPTRPPR
jgi:anti-sigma B factor antagonist